MLARGRRQIGRVGLKLEIGNAAPGLCDEGLISRPDALDLLKGPASPPRALSLGPQPQPIVVPEAGRFCFAVEEGLPEFLSSGLQRVSLQKGMIMTHFMNLPSKYFFLTPRKNFHQIENDCKSERSSVGKSLRGRSEMGVWKGCHCPVFSGWLGSAGVVTCALQHPPK